MTAQKAIIPFLGTNTTQKCIGSVFVLEAAACRLGSRWIDRRIAFDDVRNLAVQIHYERGAIRHSHGWNQHTVHFRNLTIVIAHQGITRVQFLGPVIERRREIRTDGDYLTVESIEFANTRLVGGEFLRSATAECGRKERQYDGFLTAVIG